MRKISSVVTGVLLKNTTPGGIEDFLVDKVRNELGEYHDLVNIKPVLRIDKEDGDLSGNVTDGFGTVMLTSGNRTIHLPFIIHQKQLLPFDVIRMADQEVVYDLSKLRRIVVGMDKALKEKEVDETGSDAMSVVDSRDIPTQNGFLGTIMSVRNNHRNRDVNGAMPFDGMGFGEMDDARFQKRASAEVEVAETFENFHEKLAEVRIFSNDDVKQVVRGIEKEAEEHANNNITTITEAKETIDQIGVRREFAKLDEKKLASYKRAASGNNIIFPVFDKIQFEFRQGRVYHKVKSSVGNTNSKIKHVIIDTRHHYALLKDNDEFMISTEQPPNFEFPLEYSRGLLTGEMYAFEWDTETISVPFFVKRQYIEEEENNGIIVSVPERSDRTEWLKASQSTIFRNAFECEENGKRFTIVTVRGDDGSEEVRELNREEVAEYITMNAQHSTDHRISSLIAGRFYSDKVFFVHEDAKFFKMFKNITGHFTRPDGLFKEGPLFEKSAAYNQADKVRLHINDQANPKTYAVEYSFSAEKDVDGQKANNIVSRKMEDLTPAQAKQVLESLGFDHRKQEMFFEISKRNGRYAEFNLPSKELAKNVAPKDQAIEKAKQAVRNIANSTLNAGNFTPVLENIMADTAAEYITGVLPEFHGWAKGLKDKLASSRDVAMEFEKVANTIRGNNWTEVAYALNVKYHMDKLACDIQDGFIKNAEPVFNEIQNLDYAIEKMAYGLVNFNRDQLLRVNAPLVKPDLIKEALTHLDELQGYIKAGQELEKNAFFHKGSINKLKDLSETMIELQNKNKKNIGYIKNEAINLEVITKKGQGDSNMAKNMRQSLENLQKEFKNTTEELMENAEEQQRINHQMETKNRALMAGLGLPGLAAGSYLNEKKKDK